MTERSDFHKYSIFIIHYSFKLIYYLSLEGKVKMIQASFAPTIASEWPRAVEYHALKELFT